MDRYARISIRPQSKNDVLKSRFTTQMEQINDLKDLYYKIHDVLQKEQLIDEGESRMIYVVFLCPID